MLGLLATVASTTIVGAAGGWTAWSEPLPGGGYALVTLAPDGTIARPAVAPRGVPFDVDLGVGAGGRVVAAYSRCAREPLPAGGANPRANGGAPQYTSGRACSLRVLDLLTGAERTLPRFAASEVLPAIAGNRLAYVAVPRRAGARRAVLMVRDLRTGRRRVLYTAARRATATGAAEGPTSVDTDGRDVAVAWRRRNVRDGSFDSDVLLQGVSARRPVLAASATNTSDVPYVTALAPTVASGAVTYLLSFGGFGWCSRRFSSHQPDRTYGIERSDTRPTPVSGARDGARLVVAEVADGQTQVVAYRQGPFTSGFRPGQICG